MGAVFDLEELSKLIDSFIIEVPNILKKNPLTTDLSEKVASLMETSESPFTMAVIGQMRVGKSTLINSLVGEDLAITGVNETTATINWFKYGEGKAVDEFRVCWKDEPAENFPLVEIDNWIGDSEKASKTRYLEFFSQAEFLKNIYIVDTPGTRSVIDSHEDSLQGFLAEKKERETFHYGGTADSIVYVLMPVARENDEELLQTFESNTRIPGSSPYNSVAVIHKWETLDAEDPLEEVNKKATRIAEKLNQHVSAVIPVSGPMGQAANKVSIEVWNRLAYFMTETDRGILEKLTTRGESRFKTKEESGSALSPAERTDLYEMTGLPWPCFRTVIKLALKHNCTEGKDIFQVIKDASGHDRLLDFLQKRFFDRTRLLKSFGLLTKALSPCTTAELRLRNEIEDVKEKIKQAEESLKSIEPYKEKIKELIPAHTYIAKSLVEVEKLHTSLVEVQHNLTETVRKVRDNFNQMDRDIESLRLLDDGKVSTLSEQEVSEVRTILGCYGYSLKDRISFYADDQQLKTIEERLDHWNALKETSWGSGKILYTQMVSRLEEIADILDSE